MPSLCIADNTFENILQELPAGVCSTARELRAFVRSRSVRNAEELLRAVLLYCGLDYSLREVATNLTQTGRRISDEGIRWRLCSCEEWLRAVLQEMLPQPDREIARYSNRLILVDGTRIQAPGATSPDYCLHLGWDWMQQSVTHMEVTDFRTSESLKLYDWRAGDVALADAGYAKAPQLKAVTEKGAEFVVRCAPTSIRMLLGTGEKLNIADELRKRGGERVVTLSVRIDSGENSQDVFLHAFRLSGAAAQRARRKVHRRATKASRRTPGKDTLYLAEWMIILTSFSPEKLSAESIGDIYRARWQVELVIKRLKSILSFDALRARRGSRLARVYLLGKSLYALMIEKRALRLSSDREVEWRLWRIIADQMRGCINLLPTNDSILKPEVLKVLKERPRKRKRLRTKIGNIVKNLGLKPTLSNCLSP